MTYIDDYTAQSYKIMQEAAKQDQRTNEQLVEEIRKGSTELIEILFFKNIGVVRKYIEPYLIYYDENDLLQESFLAINDAIWKFDPDRGKFTTCFPWYVTSRIQRYSSKWKSIPSHTNSDINLYNRTFNEMEQEFGRKPRIWEIADRLCWTMDKAEQVALLTFDVKSIDAMVPGTEDSISLGETIEDTKQADMLDRVISDRFMEEVWEQIGTIVSAIEKEVLFLRFDAKMSFGQIAKEKNTNKITIHSIFNTALTKIRKNAEFRKFVMKSESLFEGSFLYQDSFSSFKNFGNSRIEECVVRREREITKHNQVMKVIDANYDLYHARTIGSRLHK